MKEENIKSYYWKVWNKLVIFSKKNEEQLCPELRYCWMEGMLLWQYYFKGHPTPSFERFTLMKVCDECVMKESCINQSRFLRCNLFSLAVYVYCQYLRIIVLQYRIDNKEPTIKGKKQENKDYPAMAVACKSKNNNDIQFGYSNCRNEIFKDKKPQLFRKLLKDQIMSIPSKSKSDFWNNPTDLCKNLPGNCAEPHAADKILRKNICHDLSELEFNVPVRPRTMEIHSYCGNCQEVFPFCKNNNPKLCSSECKSDFSKKNNCKC